MLKSKKFAIFISIVAVIVVFYSFFANRKPASLNINQGNQPLFNSVTSGEVPTQTAGQKEDDLDQMEIDINSEILLKRIYQVEPAVRIQPQLSSEIGSEIFTLPEVKAEPPPQAASSVEENKREDTLQGIIFSNHGTFAIINGKTYQQGEFVGNKLLVAIGKDYVVLRENDQEATIFLRPFLQLKQ